MSSRYRSMNDEDRMDDILQRKAAEVDENPVPRDPSENEEEDPDEDDDDDDDEDDDDDQEDEDDE